MSNMSIAYKQMSITHTQSTYTRANELQTRKVHTHNMLRTPYSINTYVHAHT